MPGELLERVERDSQRALVARDDVLLGDEGRPDVPEARAPPFLKFVGVVSTSTSASVCPIISAVVLRLPAPRRTRARLPL